MCVCVCARACVLRLYSSTELHPIGPLQAFVGEFSPACAHSDLVILVRLQCDESVLQYCAALDAGDDSEGATED